MGVYTTLPESLNEVDVVIAGGGTSSCVVASRLSDAYPDLTILVVESGRDSYSVPDVIHPILWPRNYPPGNRVSWLMTEKEEQLGNRESPQSAGNTLGGSSAINAMMYARGQGCDFDSWKTKGWTAQDLLPYLKKFETYHGKGKKELHGHDGPIQVSRGTYPTAEGMDDFLQAAEQVGIPQVEDLHDLTAIGAAPQPRYISPEAPNLHALVETDVSRILFDGDKRASGVEVGPNSAFHPDTAKSDVKTIRARKLVIASCGALRTPLLLERSGVGSPKVLEAAGVPVVEDLPGVGDGYQDHNVMLYVFESSLPPDQTVDHIHGGKMSAAEQYALAERGDNRTGWNGVDISAKIRPTPAEVEALGPEFKKAWDRDYRDVPSKPLMLVVQIAGMLWGGVPFPDGQHNTLCVYTAYPYSRGSTHITGRDVDDPPKMKLGFLSDENDIKAQVWGYKKAREVARRMRTITSETSLPVHPKFPAGSPAATFKAANETADTLDDIEYSAEDDKALEEAIRNNISTCWHGLGTCKMAPREAKGVVDENLGVYGIRGLKLADMSIVPENVCGNTMNTALLVGEKAADIFIQELRNL